MENKRNIAVDIGNTRIKSGLFVNNQLIEAKAWEELPQLKDYCLKTGYDKLGFISVGKRLDEIQALFESLQAEIITNESNLPITLDYKTPDTLGIDRIAAVIGANVEYPKKNLLIIDLGSCITYDVVDLQKVYRGGIIAPGLTMRLKAMSYQTQNLPDISGDWRQFQGELLGKSTKECLSRGAYQAIIHELNGFIAEFRQEFADLGVILTGGDALNFESKLKEPIFADLYLVLKGINRILNQE